MFYQLAATLVSLITIALALATSSVAPATVRAKATVDHDLAEFLVTPDVWYSGFSYRVKLRNLWELCPATGAVTLRVSSDASSKQHYVILWEDEYKPFRGSPPSWTDYSLDCGKYPVGKSNIRFTISLLEGIASDDQRGGREISTKQINVSVLFVDAVDDLDLVPRHSSDLANGLQARASAGGILISLPPAHDDIGCAMRLRLFRDDTLLATGTAYRWKRHDEWQRVEARDVGDPSQSPIELDPVLGSENHIEDISACFLEITGDPEVALRAGFRDFWAGRRIVPITK